MTWTATWSWTFRFDERRTVPRINVNEGSSPSTLPFTSKSTRYDNDNVDLDEEDRPLSQTRIGRTGNLRYPTTTKMPTERYTIILDFKGGTYISQIKARSIEDVQKRVNESIDWDAIRPKPTRRKVELIDDIAPTPLEGLRNVWCMSGNIGRTFALINVVKTSA